jgi:UDP-N-acetylglucosamine acyltransferase
VLDAPTRIGDRTYLMAQCHIAHDCTVGSDVILANQVLLAGHVVVGNRVFLGGAVGVHQFCRIGELAMIGAHTKVTQDCLPYVIVDGNPARSAAVHRVGLSRAGISAASVNALKRAFLAVTAGSTERAALLNSPGGDHPPEVERMLEFVRATKRGFVPRQRR